MAGATIDRLAAAEHLATRGEVLLAADTAFRLNGQIQVSEWRRADGTGEQAARLEALTRPAEDNPWRELPPGELAEEQVRPWLLSLIYDRLQGSSGRFLADLRPVAALFIAFGGIDYDGDDRAGLLLDAFIRRLDEALEDDRKRVEVLLRLSSHSLDTGNYLASRSAAHLAISLAHRTGALDLEAAGEARIGRALWKMADYSDARAHLERGLDLSRENGLLEVDADCLLNLGIVADLIGDRSLSRAYFEQNLELRRRLGNRYREGLGLNNLGVIAWRQGNLAEAQKFFEQSLQIDREVGARSCELTPLGNLAIIANARGDNILARDYAEQSLEIARQIGDRYAQSLILGILGDTYVALGEYLKALPIFEEALSLDRETGDRQDELHRLDSLGYASLLLGDLEKARSFYEQALHLSREVGDRDGEGFSERGLCLLFFYLGDVDIAREHGERALSILYEVSNLGEQAICWTYLGHVWFQSSNIAAALDAYQHALDLCSGLQVEKSSLEPHAGLARAALEQGDIIHASVHVHDILDQAGLTRLNGLDEPFQVYRTCYQVLQAGGNAGWAREILKVGCSHLQEILAGFDLERRRMFLENVPPNREFAIACELEELL